MTCELLYNTSNLPSVIPLSGDLTADDADDTDGKIKYRKIMDAKSLARLVAVQEHAIEWNDHGLAGQLVLPIFYPRHLRYPR